MQLNGEVKKAKEETFKESLWNFAYHFPRKSAYVYEKGAGTLLFGNGQSGIARLSDQAATFFKDVNCEVVILPTR
jgi:hypothetical protein